MKNKLFEKFLSKNNVTSRKAIIYPGNLESNKPLEFSYRIHVKYPIRAKTPKSTVYDYYNPGVNHIEEPVMLDVL